ncbi:MAG: methyltransferase domain-containing protein [Thaumarchaeota archaeon]|nr:methyltransferase domain-containing protein [Nitrososphaerota archaeon]
MSSFPDWADKFYSLYSTPYTPGSEQAKLRLEQALPRLLKHLPRKGSRVLDLCCGAGVYLFGLEEAGYEMTGLDIQDRMLSVARRHAKKSGSTARIVKGDAMDLKFRKETFDAVVFLGAATGHFTITEVGRIMGEVRRVLKPGGVVVTEINDHVGLFLSGMYQRILYEPSGDDDVVSIHSRYDGEKGTFNRLFLDLETNKKFKASFQIWAPWIFNYVMEEKGFELIGSEPGAFGVFSRIYAHTKPGR